MAVSPGEGPRAKWEQKEASVIPSKEQVEKWIADTVFKPFEGVMKTVVADMRTVSDLIFQGKIAEALAKLSPYFAASFAISIVFDLLQSQVVGTSINLKKTLDKIDRLMSWELVASTIVGVMVGSGVETPAKYFFNSVFTPVIPDVRTLSIGYFKRYYSLEELKRYYRFHGIPDRFHKLVLDLNDFTPSLFQMERLVRYYPPSREKLVDWLRENGVTEDELDYWLNYLDYSVVRDEYAKLEAAVKDMYINGLMSAREMDSLLTEIKASEREKWILSRMLSLLKMKRLYEMYIMKHVYLFRKGVIDVGELYSRLARLYADKEFAQARTAMEAARLGIDYP